MANVSRLDFYLCVLRPVTVFTGRVNGSITDPHITVTWDGGATGTASAIGTSGAPVGGNTVHFGTSEGGRERGIVRLLNWVPSGGPAAGTLNVSENDDVTPFVEDNDYITIKLDWRLWNKVPRFVQSGTEVTQYEDYFIAYNDQTADWYPVAVAGPPAVVFLEGGSAEAKFVGDRSTPMAPGATITTYLWTAHGSNETASSSQGTEASPVTFTWAAAGQYLISLEVTDSNGNSHTNYTWVFVVDPANPDDVAYTQFDSIQDSNDFAGAGNSSFVVHGTADVSEFPRDAMVVHAFRGDVETPTASWPFRTNILFAGFVQGNTVQQNPEHNTTSFQASTIISLMSSLRTYAVSLTDVAAPGKWTEASNMTVDRLAAYLFLWRSSLSTMTPVIFTGYAPLVFRQDFSPGNLLQQLQSELISEAFGQVTASSQGVLHLHLDYNLMLPTERSAITSRKLLHKGIWIGDVEVDERSEYATPTSKVNMSGVAYSGGGSVSSATPLFSEAPGELQRVMGNQLNEDEMILNDQTDLNIRCGYRLAKENLRFPIFRMSFVNDGSFDVAPQEVFPANIEPTDNNRGLRFTGDLIPRRIRRNYDHRNGIFIVEVEFEPSSTGNPGVTVTFPDTPTQGTVTPNPATWEPVPALALVSWSQNPGVNYFGLGSATWNNRDTGISQVQLPALFGGIDPWWWTPTKANSYNPDNAIFWRLGTGVIKRSTNAGKSSWDDVTPTGTSANLEFVGVVSDIFSNGTHYFIARENDGSGSYSGYILKTDDDGSTYSWGTLT